MPDNWLPLPPPPSLTDQNGFCKCPAPISMRWLLPGSWRRSRGRSRSWRWQRLTQMRIGRQRKWAMPIVVTLAGSWQSCRFGQRIWLWKSKTSVIVLGATLGCPAQVAGHLNSIVAFFMRFLFLFNLLVPFFFFLSPTVSPPMSVVCMTNMLFFSALTSFFGGKLDETGWYGLVRVGIGWDCLCCLCVCPADVIIVSSTLRI